MNPHKKTIKTKAKLGKRILAGFTDYSLIFIYMAILLYFFGEPNGQGAYSVSGLPAFSIMIVWFVLTVLMEQLMGATIGNMLFDLQAVPKQNPTTSISFGQSFKRHLLDIFDLWPFGLLGIILIKNTKYNQRLGDLWAKTVVIDLNDPEQNLKL